MPTLTPEQMQAEIDRLTTENASQKARITTLEANESKQNSYITKLEGERKLPPGNSATDKFIQESFRESTINKAIAQLQKTVAPREIELLMPELTAFLDKNMTIANMSQDFIVNAFKLIYGGARMDPNHALNKPVTPTPPGPQQPTPPNPQRPPLPTVPPVQTGGEGGGNPVPPLPNPNPIKTTKDAFKVLDAKLRGAGNQQQ